MQQMTVLLGTQEFTTIACKMEDAFLTREKSTIVTEMWNAWTASHHFKKCPFSWSRSLESLWSSIRKRNYIWYFWSVVVASVLYYSAITIFKRQKTPVVKYDDAWIPENKTNDSKKKNTARTKNNHRQKQK